MRDHRVVVRLYLRPTVSDGEAFLLHSSHSDQAVLIILFDWPPALPPSVLQNNFKLQLHSCVAIGPLQVGMGMKREGWRNERKANALIPL